MQSKGGQQATDITARSKRHSRPRQPQPAGLFVWLPTCSDRIAPGVKTSLPRALISPLPKRLRHLLRDLPPNARSELPLSASVVNAL